MRDYKIIVVHHKGFWYTSDTLAIMEQVNKMLKAIHSGDVVFDKAGLRVVMGSDGNSYANNTGSDYVYVDDHKLLAWKQINIHDYYPSTDSFLKECFSEWYFSLEDNIRREYVEEIIGLTLEAHIPF